MSTKPPPATAIDPSPAWPSPDAADAMSPPRLWPNPNAELGFGSREPERRERSSIEILLDAIETHITEEADSLEGYRQLAETTSDPVIALLMRLVLEDEQRHHGLMQRLGSSLRDGLYWTHSSGALPDGTRPCLPATAATVAAVRCFVRDEQRGAQELKELARESSRLNEGLDSLLLEIMAMDSEKHARILRYVERRLQARAK